ncbi:MAG: hypothetical protein U0805_08990 [Pirellulales bacterium]
MDLIGRHFGKSGLDRSYDVIAALLEEAEAFSDALVRGHPANAFDFSPEVPVHARDYSTRRWAKHGIAVVARRHDADLASWMQIQPLASYVVEKHRAVSGLHEVTVRCQGI